MFSGIVEGLAEVRAAHRGGQGMRLSLDLSPFVDGVRIGDSVSVSGVCLTVTRLESGLADFDLVAETLARTTLGDLRPGSKVNIERSLRIGDRLHGHFVLGHVDGVGRILRIELGPEGGIVEIQTDPALIVQMIPKGSVAVDGISLTLVELKPSSFTIALIPHTLAVTSLGLQREGGRVNVEVDMLGKWVRRLLAGEEGDPAAHGGRGLTLEKLREAGFA